MSRVHRWFDVVGAAAGLVVFAPAMAVTTAAILVEDGPPVFFRQVRVGYRRGRFEILKFRSMRGGQVTRVGRVLRATGLDEVPQFVNILRGDMSAVGPRPLTAEDVARLGWSGPECDFRWECRPGLTGLAQLLGARPDADALVLDGVHSERWSAWLDCQLIAWSFAVNAFGKGRVRRWLRVRASLEIPQINADAHLTVPAGQALADHPVSNAQLDAAARHHVGDMDALAAGADFVGQNGCTEISRTAR